MRRSHIDSQLRIAIAALHGPDGYVDALLGLAREQSFARQTSANGALASTARDAGSRQGLMASRPLWH